jgi:hypothetical protein
VTEGTGRMWNIEIKQDAARENKKKKVKLSLVPSAIIYAIAKVLEYGDKKYNAPQSWKYGDIADYRDALYRHFLAYLDNPKGLDESGFRHIDHLAANVAILIALEERDMTKENK